MQFCIALQCSGCSLKFADVAAFIHHLMRFSLTMVMLGHPGVYTCRVLGSVKAISVKYEIMKRKKRAQVSSNRLWIEIFIPG